MALIKCYECSREISDKAPTCPNCGAPAKQRPQEQPHVGDCRTCGNEVAVTLGDRCPKCGEGNPHGRLRPVRRRLKRQPTFFETVGDHPWITGFVVLTLLGMAMNLTSQPPGLTYPNNVERCIQSPRQVGQAIKTAALITNQRERALAADVSRRLILRERDCFSIIATSSAFLYSGGLGDAEIYSRVLRAVSR